MTKPRAPIAIVLLGALTSLPSVILPTAAQQTDRAKQVGGKFMCMCGCNQVLTQCNHVGCTVSASMLKELDQSLARGDSETAITQMFVQEFGTKVYAEPPKSGLSLVAWILPSFFLVLGAGIVVFVISRWIKGSALEVASVGEKLQGISAEILESARARAARETED